MRIVGVLLAAGKGARFGGDKLLAPLPRASRLAAAGTPIGIAAAIHLVAAVPDSIAVVRPHDTMLAEALRRVVPRVVDCPRADDGLGASLACGVSAAAEADGWIIALADMPWIEPATIAGVAAALASGAGIAAARCGGRRGHPVGFSRIHQAALARLSGDAGARSILEQHRRAIMHVDVTDPGIHADVDTLEDLHRQPNDAKPRAV